MSNFFKKMLITNSVNKSYKNREMPARRQLSQEKPKDFIGFFTLAKMTFTESLNDMNCQKDFPYKN